MSITKERGYSRRRWRQVVRGGGLDRGLGWRDEEERSCCTGRENRKGPENDEGCIPFKKEKTALNAVAVGWGMDAKGMDWRVKVRRKRWRR